MVINKDRAHQIILFKEKWGLELGIAWAVW
jgi:hypothetical protein